MDANDVIAKILEDAEKIEKENEQMQRKERERLSAILMTKAKESLTDHPQLSWILNHGVSSVVVDGNKFYFRWKISDEDIEKLQVCPIFVFSKDYEAYNIDRLEHANPLSFEYKLWGGQHGSLRSCNTIDAWLRDAREKYQSYKQEVVKDKVRSLYRHSLPGENNGEYHHALNIDRNRDETLAVTLFDKLVGVDPDNKEKYENQMREFREWMARYEKEKAERKVSHEAYQKECTEYVAAYVAYIQECRRVHANNVPIVEALQAEMDKPFQLFELTYASVAFDDEEKFVEKEKVFVRSSGSKDGFFVMMDREVVKFYHPISLKPIQAVASKGLSYSDFYSWAVPYFLNGSDDQGMSVLYFIRGETNLEQIKEVLTSRGFLPYPEMPDASETMNMRGEVGKYIGEAFDIADGKEPEKDDEETQDF